MLVRFLKNWTLPLAMLSGTLGYFILANVPFLAPTKPYINDLIAYITPLLIFAQLLLTFCKVEKLNELKPKAWLVAAVSDNFMSGNCRFAGMLSDG